MEGEAILFHPQKSQFVVLNRTSAFLWSALEKPSTAEVLAAGICQSFSGVALPQALTDVEQTLKEFVSLDVVLAAEQSTV